MNKQYADADAKSVQYKPSNTNISVRVLSPGDDGDVSQENNSYADATAKNDNNTDPDDRPEAALEAAAARPAT